MRGKSLSVLGAMAICCTVSAAAFAEEWPTRVVKIIVPYGPGGGVDSFARPIATAVSEASPHRLIIENRSGAGGTIGVQVAARAPADGETLLAGGVHQPMSEPLYPQRGYRIEKDFVPIAITAEVPNVLVVPAASRFNTVSEIIAEAKAKPGKLTYCSSGNGTSQHIIAEVFKKKAGVDILHVPYRGTAPAMTDLIAGVCDMMFDGMGTSAPQIEGKKLKALALTVLKRSTRFPELPTLEEAGGPSIDASIWYALWAPAATSPQLVDTMRKKVRAALASATVRQAWHVQGAVVPAIADKEVVQFVERETASWGKAVTDLGIKLE